MGFYKPYFTLPPKTSIQAMLKTLISQSCECPQPYFSKCPSDLISLSFFLWAARQPNYFHDLSSFDLMVPVVHRLSDPFGKVSGIVDELEGIGCGDRLISKQH
ncbi:hypothetical protein IHE45_13G069000 [Dioscorea alata]|uniref:Uncharacterized protein n=1 Tax=Dioscorea alata TaxID=55571 RepID=A0ACB7UZ38_DIOAL|nr:hypothetical protein IHE45_13G069000 [Dioscorea alata]